MKFAITFVVLLFSVYAKACLQFYVVNERGDGTTHADHSPAMISRFSDPKGERLCYYAELFYKSIGDDKYRAASDYAGMLIKGGRSDLALGILQKVVIKLPGEYNVLANIAVAYELQGRYDSAWKYLNLAMSKNKDSHRGSEWIHKLILGYAVAQKGNSRKKAEGSILQLGKDTSDHIGYDIGYQFHERIPLTTAPNELLSRTIEEGADYFRKNISLEWAINLYAIAIAYCENPIRKNKMVADVDRYMLRLLELNKKMKLKSEYKEKNWKAKFQQKVEEWANYKPFRYPEGMDDIQL
jgi:tetratricopeptide (TPR) repeat protein